MSSWTWHNSWYIKSKIWRDLNDVLTESQSFRANSDLTFNSVSDFSLWSNLYVSIHHDTQVWRRRIQTHIASSSSWLSLWNCWLRAATVFRPLIRSQRVLVDISYWRAIFAWKEFSLTAEASFQRAWASIMRFFYESSISSEGMKNIERVREVTVIVLLICWRIISIEYEMWIFSPIGLSDC